MFPRELVDRIFDLARYRVVSTSTDRLRITARSSVCADAIVITADSAVIGLIHHDPGWLSSSRTVMVKIGVETISFGGGRLDV